MASYVLGDVIVEYLETLPTVSSAQKKGKKEDKWPPRRIDRTGNV
jgi:hypothetical protein